MPHDPSLHWFCPLPGPQSADVHLLPLRCPLPRVPSQEPTHPASFFLWGTHTFSEPLTFAACSPPAGGKARGAGHSCLRAQDTPRHMAVLGM